MPTTPSATPPVHTKTDHRPGALDVEAAGLAWLADAAARHGGAPVLPLVSAPPGAAGIPGVPVPPGPAGQLRTVRLPSGRPDAAAAEAFGRLLARTHAAGAPWFGAPPAGWAHDGVMGDAPLPLRQEPPAAPATPGAPDDGAAPDGSVTAGAPPHDGTGWGEFYATDRLLPYLPATRRNGSLDADDERLIRRLADRLATGALDHPLPELVTTPAARIHGDLWAGNVLWTTDPGLLPDTPGLAQARAAVAGSSCTCTPRPPRPERGLDSQGVPSRARAVSQPGSSPARSEPPNVAGTGTPAAWSARAVASLSSAAHTASYGANTMGAPTSTGPSARTTSSSVTVGITRSTASTWTIRRSTSTNCGSRAAGTR